MNLHTDEQLEQLLKALPRFDRNKAADKAMHKSLRGSVSWVQWFGVFRVAISGGLAAVFLMTSTTIFAAYQPNVTRGHILYPVKKTVESVELVLSFSPQQKMATHLRFSNRRLKEAQELITLRDESTASILTEATLNEMRTEVLLASQIAQNGIPSLQDVRPALEQLETSVESHVTTLTLMSKQNAKVLHAVLKNSQEMEDEHLSTIVEANEEVKDAVIEKRKKVHFTLIPVKTSEVRNEYRGEAAHAVTTTRIIFNELAPEQQAPLEIKMGRAEEALREGQMGKAQGLSRALQKKMGKTKNEENDDEEGESPRAR